MLFGCVLKRKRKDQAKKMGWKNPPMQLSRETRIVSRKGSTSKILPCQDGLRALFMTAAGMPGRPGVKAAGAPARQDGDTHVPEFEADTYFRLETPWDFWPASASSSPAC